MQLFQKNYFLCNINTKEEKKISVVTIIFKDFFSRELMKSFTAKKQSGTKAILCKTRFYKCFLGKNTYFFIHYLSCCIYFLIFYDSLFYRSNDDSIQRRRTSEGWREGNK